MFRSPVIFSGQFTCESRRGVTRWPSLAYGQWALWRPSEDEVGARGGATAVAACNDCQEREWRGGTGWRRPGESAASSGMRLADWRYAREVGRVATGWNMQPFNVRMLEHAIMGYVKQTAHLKGGAQKKKKSCRNPAQIHLIFRINCCNRWKIQG